MRTDGRCSEIESYDLILNFENVYSSLLLPSGKLINSKIDKIRCVADGGEMFEN